MIGADGSLPHLGNRYYYMLTDPAIYSVDREFGESDLGKAGIDAFFEHHVYSTRRAYRRKDVLEKYSRNPSTRKDVGACAGDGASRAPEH